MLLTLIKALETTDFQTVVAALSLPPIDIDLLLYDAQEQGEIKVDRAKKKITPLKDTDYPYYDRELAIKIVQIIEYYDEQEANITKNRLGDIVLGVGSRYGYPTHDFFCTLYCLENNLIPGFKPINKYEINVPKVKDKRPFNKFVFYTFVDHQEFGAKAVNNYIDAWAKANVK